MRILEVWTLKRGRIDPPEPLEKDANDFVVGLWQSYDNGGSLDIVRRFVDWYGEDKAHPETPGIHLSTDS